MKSTLPPIDINEFKQPRFSHAEMLYITGLSADTVLTWYKRGLLPENEERKRRGGGRRKYAGYEVVHLAIMRALVKAHVPVLSASVNAARLISFVVKSWALMRYCETEEEMNSILPVLLAIYDLDEPQGEETLHFEVFGEVSELPAGGIQQWMREKSLIDVSLIDLGGLTMSVFHSMEEKGFEL